MYNICLLNEGQGLAILVHVHVSEITDHMGGCSRHGIMVESIHHLLGLSNIADLQVGPKETLFSEEAVASRDFKHVHQQPGQMHENPCMGDHWLGSSV